MATEKIRWAKKLTSGQVDKLSTRRLTKNLKNKNYYGQEIYLENGHSDLDQHSDGYWYDAGGNQLYDVKKTPASLGLAGGAGEFP